MADVHEQQDADRLKLETSSVVRIESTVSAWVADDRVAALSVSKAIYSRRAVLAAAYKLSGRCAILVDSEDERWILYLVPPQTNRLGSLFDELARELNDQALRQELDREFGSLRELIVAQAFSEGNLLDPSDR